LLVLLLLVLLLLVLLLLVLLLLVLLLLVLLWRRRQELGLGEAEPRELEVEGGVAIARSRHERTLERLDRRGVRVLGLVDALHRARLVAATEVHHAHVLIGAADPLVLSLAKKRVAQAVGVAAQRLDRRGEPRLERLVGEGGPRERDGVLVIASQQGGEPRAERDVGARREAQRHRIVRGQRRLGVGLVQRGASPLRALRLAQEQRGVAAAERERERERERDPP